MTTSICILFNCRSKERHYARLDSAATLCGKLVAHNHSWVNARQLNVTCPHCLNLAHKAYGFFQPHEGDVCVTPYPFKTEDRKPYYRIEKNERELWVARYFFPDGSDAGSSSASASRDLVLGEARRRMAELAIDWQDKHESDYG